MQRTTKQFLGLRTDIQKLKTCVISKQLKNNENICTTQKYMMYTELHCDALYWHISRVIFPNLMRMDEKGVSNAEAPFNIPHAYLGAVCALQRQVKTPCLLFFPFIKPRLA